MNRVRWRPEAWLLGAVVALLGLSVLMVMSTTALTAGEGSLIAPGVIRKHLFQIVIGLGCLGIFSQIRSQLLYRAALLLLVLTVLSLVLVLVPGVGYLVGGARRWFALGPLRIQPGEIAKLCIAVYTASYIGRHHGQMLRFVPGAMIPLVSAAIFSLLLLAQPDFGTTVILLCVVFSQLLTASRIKHLVGLGVGALGAAALLVWISPYRFRRVESFLNPLEDASASGYQLVQSLIAVGSGGVAGQGLGAGRQKLFYLPAAHTDFIFAVIAEELGFLGCLGVIVLFLIVAACGLAIARRHLEDPFLASLAVGLTALLVIPAFLNMGVVVGLLPTKGLVLPFVAYGGTAMVVNLTAVGILLRLAREERER